MAQGYYLGDLRTDVIGVNLWRTVRAFGYETKTGERIYAEEKFTFDGASIPRVAWSLVGGPASDGNFEPACIHDWGCMLPDKYERRWIDDVFREMLLFNGKSRFKARMMWLFVRAHGIWVGLKR